MQVQACIPIESMIMRLSIVAGITTAFHACLSSYRVQVYALHSNSEVETKIYTRWNFVIRRRQ